ncbi:MAG TPA: SIMPL domain-containing protein [Candidatus Nitrosocosmicus sp.]|nr:SIMPL domain-containing protein [Candidatus Nitrosocosmicus sp.]
MNDIKKAIIYTLIILTGFFLYSQFGPGLPLSVMSTVSTKESLFSSTGEGRVSAIPDQAVIRLGMQINTPSIANGQEQINKTVNELLDKLKSMGIDKKDIKTENYSINPNYDRDPNRASGYNINTNVVVTVRDLTKLNSVIDTATATGLNSIGGIEFTLSDDKKSQMLEQARRQAVQEAKNKANSLSRASGIKLGRIINVEENNNQYNPPVMMMKAEDARSNAAVSNTQIEPGSTDIVLSVTLSYETK